MMVVARMRAGLGGARARKDDIVRVNGPEGSPRADLPSGTPSGTVDPIRNLGRTIFLSAVIPWALSGVVPMGPLLMILFPIAMIGPRFVFRRQRARVEVRWNGADTAWLVAAMIVYLAYLAGIGPALLGNAVAMGAGTTVMEKA